MEPQNTWIEQFTKENKTVREICMAHNTPALEVLQALKHLDNVSLRGKEHVKPLLKTLVGQNPMTVIVEKEGCIFEMKCNFPQGVEAYGYYNFKPEGPVGLHGHMDIAHINHVAATSEIFFNKPSKSWWFIHQNGHVIFKVYVGRKDNGDFVSEQLAIFENWLKK